MALAGLVVMAVVIASLATFAPSPKVPGRGASQFGGPSTVPLGEVSGIASPCVGLTTLAGLEALPVRVTLSQGSEFIGSETVTGDHKFLMAARPGRYLITSDQYQRPSHVSVVLHAFETVHVDLPVYCK
jgi:hypothetical protein